MKRTDTNTLGGKNGIAAPLPGWLLLLIGLALSALSGYRWGVSALAWAAPVPFLLYARRVRRVKHALVLLGTLLVASFAQVSKIVTPGLFAFACLTAVGDWLSFAISPIGAWGATGNSQVDSLVLLQFASLFGLPGIGFLMGVFQSSLSLLLGSEKYRVRWQPFAISCLAVSLVLVYGAFRLTGTQAKTVTAAGAYIVAALGLSLRRRMMQRCIMRIFPLLPRSGS